MAKVVLTEYECSQDLLPDLCARCGAPAAAKVGHGFRVLSPWLGFLLGLPLLYSLFFLPPLAVLIMFRVGRHREVQVPLCPRHRAARMWRDRMRRRVVFPVWTVVVVSIDALLITEAVLGGPGRAVVAAYFALVLVGFVEAFVISRETVAVGQNRHKSVTLGKLHPAFVAALTEDRARDRVSNPARRGGGHDVRADYDDLPN